MLPFYNEYCWRLINAIQLAIDAAYALIIVLRDESFFL